MSACPRLLLLVGTLATLAFPAHADSPGYGKRSQVGQLARALDRHAAGLPATPAHPGLIRRQPLLQKIAAFLRPGFSTKDDVGRIERFLAETERRFGDPISRLEHPAMKDGQRMRAEKALALLTFGRSPEEVTETFIRTQAKVAGAQLTDRDVFVQRWRPIGTPSGKVFVMAPGFLQTGRNFYEQVQLLNAEGHEVVVMDQQWAGYSADAKLGVQKGGIDRGFGIARDVADAAAYGNELLEREYGTHPNKQLVLVGTSMGAGPGVLGALALYDAVLIELGPGRSIPANRGYILQGAFLGATKSAINDTLGFAGRIRWLRDLWVPATGLPLLNDDPRTNAKLAAHAAAEDLRGRLQAFRAALGDIDTIIALIEKHGAPKGRGFFLHAEKDYLANPQIMQGVAAKMGAKPGGAVQVMMLPGRDHVMEETAVEQRHILSAAKAVTQQESP